MKANKLVIGILFIILIVNCISLVYSDSLSLDGKAKVIAKNVTRFIIDSGTLYTWTESELNAYELKSMTLKWRFEVRKAGVFVHPTVGGGNVFFSANTPGPNTLFAVNASNGQLKWKRILNLGIDSSLLYINGELFVGGYDDIIQGINGDTGVTIRKIRYSNSHCLLGPFAFGENIIFVAEPSVVYVYNVGVMTLNGYSIFSYNRMSGKRNWEFRQISSPVKAMVLDTGVLFFGETSRTTKSFFALEPDNGRLFPVEFKTDCPIYMMAARNGWVFAGGKNKILYAFDLNTNQQKWQFKTDGTLAVNPVIYQNMLIFASDDKTLYALDVISGVELWRLKSNNIIGRSQYYAHPITPLIVESTLYFLDEGGSLYALDLTTMQK